MTELLGNTDSLMDQTGTLHWIWNSCGVTVLTYRKQLYGCFHVHDWERAIMDFNRNLPTQCIETILMAIISWIAGMALIMAFCNG